MRRMSVATCSRPTSKPSRTSCLCPVERVLQVQLVEPSHQAQILLGHRTRRVKRDFEGRGVHCPECEGGHCANTGQKKSLALCGAQALARIWGGPRSRQSPWKRVKTRLQFELSAYRRLMRAV